MTSRLFPLQVIPADKVYPLSQTVSAPSALSPAPFAVSAGQLTHALFSTCSLAAQRVAADYDNNPHTMRGDVYAARKKINASYGRQGERVVVVVVVPEGHGHILGRI